MKKIGLFPSFIFTIIFVASGHATPILQINDQGLLIGADRVNIAGGFYDVRFSDSDFDTLFLANTPNMVVLKPIPTTAE